MPKEFFPLKVSNFSLNIFWFWLFYFDILRYNMLFQCVVLSFFSFNFREISLDYSFSVLILFFTFSFREIYSLNLDIYIFVSESLLKTEYSKFTPLLLYHSFTCTVRQSFKYHHNYNMESFHHCRKLHLAPF